MFKRLSRLAAMLGFIAVIGAFTLPAQPAPAASHHDPGNPCKKGYHQLTIAVTTTASNVADGDRLWDSHAAYIKASHRDFIISYSLAKGPELASPLDPGSAPTGNTTYVLNECYKTSGDITEHWEKTAAEWQDFQAILDWMGRPGTQVVTLHDGTIRNALWAS